MELESQHLLEIFQRHNRTCNALVVFLDVEKCSKRRTASQIEAIDSFTRALTDARDFAAKKHLDYAQRNDLNFRSDVIAIPTGDGAAVVFTFEGLHSIHLDFALEILRIAWEQRSRAPCDQFFANGWCNCHSYINLRIGVAEGKVVLFRDFNGKYNVAGNAINLASRVMSLADHNQIVFAEPAYKQIIDMIDDPKFVTHFREFRDVRIKHNEKLNVYQYVADHGGYLNCEPPADLILHGRMLDVLKQMKGLGFPAPDIEAMEQVDKVAVVQMMEKFASAMGQARAAIATLPTGSEQPILPPLEAPSSRVERENQSKKD